MGDKKLTGGGRQSADSEPEEIIEDLESIKDLLVDEDDAAGTSPPAAAAAGADKDARPDAGAQPPEIPPAEDIPLLDDPIDTAVSVDEGLSDDTIKSLLDDTWKDSVEAVLQNARSTIEDHSTTWLPKDTDELNAALKIRIDTSVRQWLEEVLQANIGALRKLIVRELSTELLQHLQHKLGADRTQQSSPDTNPDKE